MFGLSAAEAAAILMEHWQFPAHMVEAMRHHLDPIHTPELPAESCLLNFAGGSPPLWGRVCRENPIAGSWIP